MTTLHLPLGTRAVLVRDGRALRALAPGRYVLWRRHDVIRWDTAQPVFAAAPAVLAVLPHDWYEVVHVTAGHYGIVDRDTRAVAFLRPGIHRVWKVDGGVAASAWLPTPTRCRS